MFLRLLKTAIVSAVGAFFGFIAKHQAKRALGMA